MSPSGDGFTPRYGIVAPAIDFTMYNKERSSTINVSPRKLLSQLGFIVCVCVYSQNWDYPRNNLVYLRELGEGQFGKVLLMKAKVCSLSVHNYIVEIEIPSLCRLHVYVRVRFNSLRT